MKRIYRMKQADIKCLGTKIENIIRTECLYRKTPAGWAIFKTFESRELTLSQYETIVNNKISSERAHFTWSPDNAVRYVDKIDSFGEYLAVKSVINFILEWR